jgi:hypothetical protein
LVVCGRWLGDEPLSPVLEPGTVCRLVETPDWPVRRLREATGRAAARPHTLTLRATERPPVLPTSQDEVSSLTIARRESGRGNEKICPGHGATRCVSSPYGSHSEPVRGNSGYRQSLASRSRTIGITLVP